MICSRHFQDFDDLIRVYDGGHVAVNDVNLRTSSIHVNGHDVCDDNSTGVKPGHGRETRLDVPRLDDS